MGMGRRRVRWSIVVVLAIVASAVAAGCGDDDPGAASSAEAGFPRTVGTGFAEVEIPARPERVVATADRDQLDVLLALGIEPVAYGRSGDYPEPPPWLDAAQVEGLESMSMPGSFEPNIEGIAAAQPDLIVDAFADETGYARLRRIAPTIEIKIETTDSWQDAQRLAGEATGEEDAAEAAIDETVAIQREQGERLAPLAGRSVALAFIDGDALVMIPGDEIGGRCLSELGLTVHPTPTGTQGRFSLERIGELLGDADVIVSFDYGSLDAQEANPLFTKLPAVRAGRYVTIPTEVASACYQESSLSMRWAAPRIADAVLGAG